MISLLEARASDERRGGGEPVVIFLGDYVDRGRQSAAVIDLLLSERPTGYERRFLKGNHEELMLAFMAEPLANRAWLLQGGAETLASYGVTPPSPLAAAEADWIKAAEDLKTAVPSAHMDFLNGLERYLAMGGYAFVHAGVNASRALERQTDADLYWSRERFLNSTRRFSHCVVHGHTPSEKPYADRRRIGVDTGAYATGTLTAARFEGEEVHFISVPDRNGGGVKSG